MTNHDGVQFGHERGVGDQVLLEELVQAHGGAGGTTSCRKVLRPTADLLSAQPTVPLELALVDRRELGVALLRLLLAAGELVEEVDDADLIIKATKVDGVYDKDPVKYSDAVKYDRLTYDTVLKQGLRVMDAAGIALAKEDKKPILVMNMSVPGNIRKAVLGENVGTLISSE